MIPIRSERLELIPLTKYQLESYLEDEDQIVANVGQVSRTILTPILQRAIRMKLEKLDQASPSDTPWITYWLIKVPPVGYGAGLVGFKGIPDEDGEVEIGYGIDSSFRNKGYVTEAVQALIHWAFDDSRCRRIIAPNTDRSNKPSNRVLVKAGMYIYAETPNEVSWCIDKERFISKP